MLVYLFNRMHKFSYFSWEHPFTDSLVLETVGILLNVLNIKITKFKTLKNISMRHFHLLKCRKVISIKGFPNIFYIEAHSCPH